MHKTFIHYFTIADYEEEELWLRQRHREGWKLVKTIAPCFFVFESCEPEDVIYRLDYRNGTQTDAYLQMCRDFGWEYCNQCKGWLYFRKSASAAGNEEDGELFSDNLSRVEMITHIVKTRMLPLLIIFLCCVVPNFVRWINGSLLSGIERGLGVFFGVMFVLYMFLLNYCGIKLTRLRRKYSD